MHTLWHEGVRPSRGVLFRHGLVFSVGLTLFPVAIAGLVWGARVVNWIVR